MVHKGDVHTATRYRPLSVDPRSQQIFEDRDHSGMLSDGDRVLGRGDSLASWSPITRQQLDVELDSRGGKLALDATTPYAFKLVESGPLDVSDAASLAAHARVSADAGSRISGREGLHVTHADLVSQQLARSETGDLSLVDDWRITAGPALGQKGLDRLSDATLHDPKNDVSGMGCTLTPLAVDTSEQALFARMGAVV